MKVIVIFCSKHIIQNCEETEVCGKVKNLLNSISLLFIKAVVTGVLTVQVNLLYINIRICSP